MPRWEPENRINHELLKTFSQTQISHFLLKRKNTEASNKTNKERMNVSKNRTLNSWESEQGKRDMAPTPRSEEKMRKPPEVPKWSEAERQKRKRKALKPLK